MKILVAFCRIFVGVLFILSGFIKANDSLGFSYKLDEYFSILGMSFFLPFSLFLSMFFCILEIVLGAAVLIGYRMRTVSRLLLLLIIFFTFLTGYSAITGKVTDCGCFGDAVKLKPVQSFYKDLALLLLIGVLFFRNGKVIPLFNEKAGLITMLFITIASTFFTLWCYNYLPVIDFRPYAIGKNIREQMVMPPGAKADEYEIIYTLQNNVSGETKKMNSNDYITQKAWEDSSWVLLSDKTESTLVTEGYHPPVHDFSIATMDGLDITDSILNYDGILFLAVAYDLKKSGRKHQPEINNLAEECLKNNIPFFGLTASDGAVIDNFKHEVQALYEFCITDETTLKTMIRSNPGIILLKKGTVISMWHHNDTPAFGEIKERFL